MTRWLRHVAAVAVVALATASWGVAVPAADADTHVSWVATGTIDRVDFDLRGAGIEVGDPFTVWFTFDTAAADLSPDDPTRGDYQDLITSVEIEIDGGDDGTFTWSATPAGTFLESTSTVFDDWLGPTGDDPPLDQWWLQASEGWSGDSLNGYTIRFLQRFLSLADTSATAFDSDALPTSPPDPAGFDATTFAVVFEDEDRFRQAIEGQIETLAVDGADDPIEVPVAEAVGVSDTVTVAVQTEVEPTEGVGVSDTVTVAVQTEVEPTEGVGVSDTVTIVLGTDVQVAETVGVGDSVTVTVGVSVSDGTLLDDDGNEQTEFYNGDPVRLLGDGFDPDSEVEIELQSDPIPLGSTTSDGTGAIDVTVVLPLDAPPGDHTLVGIGVGPGGAPHEVRAALTLLDPSPRILDVDDPAPVQHSDGLIPVTISFEDPNSPASELEVATSGLPDDVMATLVGCDDVDGTTTCTAQLHGTVVAPASTYTGQVTISDGTFDDTVAVTIVVAPEDGQVGLSPSNPVRVTVDPDTGTSGLVTLDVDVREGQPDEGHNPEPVDLDMVAVTVALEPLGPGPTVTAACDRSTNDEVLALTCTVDDLPVGTYAVGARLGGQFLAGADEDVLTVSDPDLGFATGGGEFLWPGTATPDCVGDRTSFGFTMEHNRKGTNVKGALLLVRHTCDGDTFRVRSNALDGLAIGQDGDTTWASFSGKATFLAPWLDEEQGNHAFTVYVEDADEDRFWIEVRDKDGQIIEEASLPRPPTEHAVALSDGDVVVPAERRRGTGSGRRGGPPRWGRTA